MTKDLPANVVAVGNPCRVLREINEHDREYYFKDHKIPEELLKLAGDTGRDWKNLRMDGKERGPIRRFFCYLHCVCPRRRQTKNETGS